MDGRRLDHRTFRSWLKAEIERQGVSRRSLARRLAEKHPAGVTPSTIDTYRSAIHRYLKGERVANELTRVAFADALGVDPSTVPMFDEDEEDITDMAATLQALAREHAEFGKQLGRVLKAVGS